MNKPFVWQGRIDSEESGFAQRWHQAMHMGQGNAGDVVLLGFACDAGVARNHGRPGAAQGPEAIRRMLTNIPLGRPLGLADAGDVNCVDDQLEAAQQRYAEMLADLLQSGRRVIGLGGGHEIAFGGFCGLLKSRDITKFPRIGIINFDAHFDLRGGARPTSGTPFRQIAQLCTESHIDFHYLVLGISRFANTQALFESARQLGVRWRIDEMMNYADLPAIHIDVATFIDQVDALYLTTCLDVLPPGIAPGVSAPSSRGVELAVIEPLVDQIAASGKLAYADIAELNPLFDIDHRTARIASRLVARIAEGWQ
jgi:formiminoglutamase